MLNMRCHGRMCAARVRLLPTNITSGIVSAEPIWPTEGLGDDAARLGF